MFSYIPEQQVTCHLQETALKIAALLVDEGYVVMLSREDNLYVINYIWSPNCSRSDVVFVSREAYELAIIENEISEVSDDTMD